MKIIDIVGILLFFIMGFLFIWLLTGYCANWEKEWLSHIILLRIFSSAVSGFSNVLLYCFIRIVSYEEQPKIIN